MVSKRRRAFGNDEARVTAQARVGRLGFVPAGRRQPLEIDDRQERRSEQELLLAWRELCECLIGEKRVEFLARLGRDAPKLGSPRGSAQREDERGRPALR